MSLLTLLTGAWFVLRLWYPQPYWQASGVLSVAAYAVLAHLGITALLFLPWRNRSRYPDSVQSDVAFLMFVMLGAVLFSLSYLFAGRPVALVFAVDRVALVRANEIRTTELAFAGVLRKDLRLSGPLPLIAARQSSDAERLDSIQLAMAGFDVHQRPGFWVNINVQRVQLSQKARDIGELDELISARQFGLDEARTKWSMFLPLAGVAGNWALLLDDELRSFVPVKIE